MLVGRTNNKQINELSSSEKGHGREKGKVRRVRDGTCCVCGVGCVMIWFVVCVCGVG